MRGLVVKGQDTHIKGISCRHNGPTRYDNETCNCEGCVADRKKAEAERQERLKKERDNTVLRFESGTPLEQTKVKSVEVILDFESGTTKLVPVEKFLLDFPTAVLVGYQVITSPGAYGLDCEMG